MGGLNLIKANPWRTLGEPLKEEYGSGGMVFYNIL
jgi:hypothetical protein